MTTIGLLYDALDGFLKCVNVGDGERYVARRLEAGCASAVMAIIAALRPESRPERTADGISFRREDGKVDELRLGRWVVLGCNTFSSCSDEAFWLMFRPVPEDWTGVAHVQ
jgi:hypothetical protein